MATQKKDYSELKKRALLAKHRLKIGYWQQVHEKKSSELTKENGNTIMEKLIKDEIKEKFEREMNKELGNKQVLKEEEFFEKVRKILDDDEDSINPIGKLIEHDVYDKLDDDNKQRYILELSKKFREMSARYNKELSRYRM
ncbi:MAG: hypothetical protein FWE22_01675 [Firmicutes bacterium]|nr:hypothetical protein [Bacillota bacterium]